MQVANVSSAEYDYTNSNVPCVRRRARRARLGGWLEPPDASLKFCYWFQLANTGFDAAHRQCKAVGGDLVSFTTQSEAVRAHLIVRFAR